MDVQPPVLLLVEDNEDDVFLMQRALKAARISLRMQVVTDGQEALDYLAGAGKYSNRAQYPIPSIVLLDLKLPYVHGFEVLNWLRKESALSQIGVVVLTSSPEERDQRKALELGAKAYLVKPPTGQMLLGLFPLPAQSSSLPAAPPGNQIHLLL